MVRLQRKDNWKIIDLYKKDKKKAPTKKKTPTKKKSPNKDEARPLEMKSKMEMIIERRKNPLRKKKKALC